MKLSRQLARLKEHATQTTKSQEVPLSRAIDRGERTSAMKSMMAQMAARYERRQPSLEAQRRATIESLPGEVVETALGPARVIDRTLSASTLHGSIPVGPGGSVSHSQLACLALDDSFHRLSGCRALFLDTETTGLSIGGSTLACLIGWSWFDGRGDLRTRQTLLTRFGEERPMLTLLEEQLRDTDFLVTYNGKSFDWPLLRNRFVMNRMAPPDVMHHFDLLHVARRVFKSRMARTKLVDMEREILGKVRVDDIDGSQIPEAFMDFMTAGELGLIPDILQHNHDDLLALPALLGVLAEMVADLDAVSDSRDLVPLAKLALRAGDAVRAEACARAASTEHQPDAVAYEGHLFLAEQARRMKDYRGEEKHLLAAVESARSGMADIAHFRLAILYEHRLPDLEKALFHAQNGQHGEGHLAATKRITRLHRRIEKKMMSSGPRHWPTPSSQGQK